MNGIPFNEDKVKILAIDPGPIESALVFWDAAEERILMDDPKFKKCSKCNQQKEKSEFYKNSGTSDGLGSWCKDCERSRDRKTYTKIYRKTEGYHQAKEKYRNSPKYKNGLREREKRYRSHNLEKRRAQESVKAAKKAGRLVAPRFCQICKHEGILFAHHSDYSRPLDVLWVCPLCHAKIHRKNQNSPEKPLLGVLASPGWPQIGARARDLGAGNG
jgi:hypothetical protein